MKKVEKKNKQNRGNAFCLRAIVSNCIVGSFFVSEMVDIVPAVVFPDVEPSN
jgi:hypothetical protein